MIRTRFPWCVAAPPPPASVTAPGAATPSPAGSPAPAAATANKPRTLKSKIVRPLGIASLSLLFLTALLGYFTRRHYKSLFSWHRRVAVAALIAAACHGGVVLFF